MSPPPGPERHLGARSRGALAGIAALILGGVLWIGLRREFAAVRGTLQDWTVALQAYMASNWLAFGIGQTLITVSGVLPASMVATLAGGVFGFGAGMAISTTSTMIGGWICFALSRTALRRLIARFLDRHDLLARFDTAVTSEGWRLVLLLRLSPVMPFALTSYAIGLTRVSHRDFLLGTLASLPALAGFVALGALGRAGLRMADGRAAAVQWLMLAAGLAIVVYALFRLRQVMGRVAAEGATP